MGRRVTKSATRVLASSSVSQARAMALNHHTLWGEDECPVYFHGRTLSCRRHGHLGNSQLPKTGTNCLGTNFGRNLLGYQIAGGEPGDVSRTSLLRNPTSRSYSGLLVSTCVQTDRQRTCAAGSFQCGTMALTVIASRCKNAVPLKGTTSAANGLLF